MSDDVAGDDGLPALTAGPWWQDKHYYVRRYGEIFSTGMHRKWATRIYIDLFSGPGKAVIDEPPHQNIDGSPIIALSQPKGFTHCFFADANRTYLDALKRRVADLSPSATVQYYADECNRAAASISSDLPPGRGWLGLAFIDPYNWEVSLNSIRELTKGGRRLDLMITLHVAQMVRCADSNPADLDAFMGAGDWHAEYVKRAERVRRWTVLREMYEGRLRSLGFSCINNDVLVKRPDGHPMYYLVFASRHSRGEEFWKKISARSREGQTRLPFPEA